MKSLTNFTSLSFKMVGGVMIFSSLFDYILMAIPFNISNSQWQINFTNQIVGQGVSPMIGIAFLTAGWWIAETDGNNKSKFSGVGIAAFVLASILGLLFLLLVPLHLSNISKASTMALTQINEQAGQQEAKIEGVIRQIQSISQNPEQLEQLRQQMAQIDQVLASGKAGNRSLTPQELETLKNQKNEAQQILDLSAKPEELKQKLEKRQQELQGQLKKLRTEQEKTAKNLALIQSLKTGIRSLILAIGYIVIGWFGLRSMGISIKTSD